MLTKHTIGLFPYSSCDRLGPKDSERKTLATAAAETTVLKHQRQILSTTELPKFTAREFNSTLITKLSINAVRQNTREK